MRWKTLMNLYGVPHMSDVAGADDNSQNDENDEGDKKQNNNSDNNNTDNLDLDTNIWQNDNNGDDPANKRTSPTAEQLETNFNSYVDGLNLTDGIDTAELGEQLREGNIDGLQNLIKKTASSTYKKTILDANKLVDAKVDAAVDKAVQKATSQVRGNNLVEKMHEQLPFTKKQAISPIATAMLQQLTSKGKSPADAINGVKQLFAELHKTSARDLGIANPPRNRPGNPQFNNSSAPQIDDDDDSPDWEELLNS